MEKGPGKRTDRLQIMLTEEETRALDDWRFRLRMPSRSAAVRELMRRGLSAEGYFEKADSSESSGQFGMFDHGPDQRTPEARGHPGPDGSNGSEASAGNGHDPDPAAGNGHDPKPPLNGSPSPKPPRRG